ncbi:NirD/YgiW/YdeI family stress tolerance protein [Vibrio parahaemolyticus]|nr:NirD/YgiW/YdeI family stress tolerance protein [Vibrio parahaemolyticus]EJG0893204.1 NirD/YgiW/YdeI family stress tolerance protein [Vibrio parahaemolyticus]EKA7388527.1 NirD/YgiW/YdeI family stress tolerance protein [Vibrio parahaemolyticus]ELA9320041.1 NirD/YgiW/YdeI family stress tolerance protein [Vibrio parahaemolyticus]
MKKMILASMVALLSSSAFAAFNGPEISVINTVKDAQNATEDSAVMLSGHIIQSLGNETYLFKDSTGEIEVEIDNEEWMGLDVTPNDKVAIRGEIEVEIDNEEWMGLDVTPNDKVAIRGEIDSEWTTMQIDVDTIQKL